MIVKMKNNYSNNIPYSYLKIHTYVHIYILYIYVCIIWHTSCIFPLFSPLFTFIVLYERESMLLRYGLGRPGLQFRGAFDHTTIYNSTVAESITF